MSTPGAPEREPSESLAAQARTREVPERHASAGEGLEAVLRERVERLQRVTEALGSALTVAEAAAVVVAQAPAAVGAQAAAILVRDGSAGVLHVAAANGFAASSLATSADGGDERRSVHWRSSERGAPAFPRFDDPALGRPRALCRLPLAVERRVLGVLLLGFSSDRDLPAADRALAETIGQLGAQAIARAQLYEAEHAARLAAERSARLDGQLQQATAALSRADDEGALTAALAEHVLAALDADAVTVALLDRDQLGLVHRCRSGADSERLPRRIGIDDDRPLAAAARSFGSIWLETRADVERFPALARTSTAAAAAAVPLVVGSRSLGAVAVSYEHPRNFGGDERAFLESLAAGCAQALARVRAFEAERTARRRTERLQGVSVALAEAATPADVVRVLVEQGSAAAEASAATASIVSPDGRTLRVAASIGHSPELVRRFERMRLEEPGRLPSVDCVLDGAARWFESVEAIAAVYPEVARAQAEDGVEALAVLALRHGEKVLGAIRLSFPAPRRFSGEERALLEAIARQCAQAYDRATLVEADARARRESERRADRAADLQVLTAALSQAITPEDVASVVLERALRPLEASAGSLAVLSEDGSQLQILHAVTGDASGARWSEQSADAQVALADVVRSGEPRFYASRDAYVVDYPDLHHEIVATAVGALAIVPLAAAGRPLGALALRFDGEHTVEHVDRDFLIALGRECGHALARARLFEREHRIASILQRSVLPESLPVISGYALAARYRPGSRGLDVGGDWYDAFGLPGGRVALVVGDVVGRGAAAASAMAQLRNALRVFLLDGCEPAHALRRLDRFNELLAGVPFATALVLTVELDSGVVRYASAGHPAAVIRRAAGTIEFLGTAPSPPLGIGGVTFVPGEATLGAGDLLVGYTDGLIEARSERTVDAGLALLAVELARAPSDAEALVDHLLARVPVAGIEPDDVALLALARKRTGGPGPDPAAGCRPPPLRGLAVPESSSRSSGP